jgi:ribosomal protein S16
MKRHPVRRAPIIFLACVLWFDPASAQPTTIAQDAKAAIASYADEKVKATIKEQSRAAITALYKKIYRSGANKMLVRTLGTVALSADQINTLAENAANAVALGDPEAVKAASAQVAVALGQTLTRGLKNAELRGQMSALLGGVDKINDVSDVLGQAAGGDPTAAYELAGRTLISMTPAAAVFTAAETAAGAMKYLQGKFVDGNIEELYRKYASGDGQTRADIRGQLETAGVYSYVVRDQRIKLKQDRADAIARATAEPSDRVRERLTATSEGEVVDDILRTFAARANRERAAAVVEQARKQAEAEAAAMIDALDVAARGKYGKDWTSQLPVNLESFTRIVRDRLTNDGVLDPSDPRHIRAMAQLLSTRLVHGKDSEEYRKQLAGFEEYRRVLLGTAAVAAPEAGGSQPSTAPSRPAARCAPGSATRVEADRLWTEAIRLGKSNNYVVVKNGHTAVRRSIALCPDPARAGTEKALREKWVNGMVGHIANRMNASLPKVGTDHLQVVR